MNARQKAKKYKRLYETLLKESVKVNTVYITEPNMLKFEGEARCPYEEHWAEELGDEYIRTIKESVRRRVAEDIAFAIPVEFTISGRWITGKTNIWVDRGALCKDVIRL